ncbi:MAG: hypothetical protein MK116_01220 [Phycisphaerales bacterium]|nr:hypothetical protein [Phycisphaerales bacterium]
MLRSIFHVLAPLCLFVTATVMAVPIPNAAPLRPELTYTPGPLRIFQSSEDGQWYWYMTYGVENGTGVDQIWAPSMVLYTDQGEILNGGRGVPSAVTDEILEYLADPLLEPQYSIIGELKQGRGNARSGLTVWPARKTKVNELSLFVVGLSSETAVVKHPLTGEDVVLRKSLKRDYLIPGAATARGDRPVDLHPDMPRREVWIFR